MKIQGTPRLYILGFILAVTGCKVPSVDPVMPSTEVSQKENRAPSILTLILKIKNSPDQTLPEVSLDQSIVAKGYLKNKTTTIDLNKEESILIEFFDRENNSLQIDQVESPLKKRFESTDENGELQSHDIELTEEFFSVRIQNTPEISTVKIYLVQRSQKILLQQIDI
ncbi:MAG: hypothetical protein KDC85_18675 [Saprospiraceae bacterium]|nr:hypothetical protein [Saprospiraceae bacterium]MCB9322990.1 hypothetical protein [Lewinellaceae bacterium]